MPPFRAYSLPIAIRQTAATAANAVPWAMLLPSTARRAIVMRRLIANVMFDGTAAASQSAYQLKRFRSTTPSGGTALTPIPHNLLDKGATGVSNASVVTASFLDTGLTVAGIAVDGPIMSLGGARQVSSTAFYDIAFETLETGASGRALTIDPGDGLCLALGVVAVVGDGIQGWVSWDEAIV